MQSSLQDEYGSWIAKQNEWRYGADREKAGKKKVHTFLGSRRLNDIDSLN